MSTSVLSGYYDLLTDYGVTDTSKERAREKLVSMLNSDNFIIVTAENPNAKKTSKWTNDILNAKLRAVMTSKGLNYRAVNGHYGGNIESSFIVTNGSKSQAVELCKQFNQESVLIKDGLINRDGNIIASRIKDASIIISDKLKEMYSIINIDGFEFKFQYPLQF